MNQVSHVLPGSERIVLSFEFYLSIGTILSQVFRSISCFPQQIFVPSNQFVSEDRALRTENEKAQFGVSAKSAMFDLVEKSIK